MADENEKKSTLHTLAASLRSPQTNHYLSLLALVCTIVLSAALTSINRMLVLQQHAQQSILAAFFCIEAAAVYALYMIISRMLSFVLSYIEVDRQHDRSGYMGSYYYDYIEEDEESSGGQPKESPFFLRHYHESPLFFSSRPGFNNGHREALISSMYLGGAGAFLALPALCFWDFSISASFLLSLAVIAFFSDHTKQKDFAPNQDKLHVLALTQRFRWLLYGSVFAVILGIAFQDSYYYYYLYYNSPGRVPPANRTAVPLAEITAAERPSWPMMLLSFCSPLLMRMGTINPRTIAHKILMSPSQSLEAGLPISTLLAILVLCWYSPLDRALMQASTSDLTMQAFVPMLVLCPSCMAAILAFILRGFHKKQTLGVVVPLTAACVAVQQAVERKMRARGDWVLVAGTAMVLSFSLLFHLYLQRVQDRKKRPGAPPPDEVEFSESDIEQTHLVVKEEEEAAAE